MNAEDIAEMSPFHCEVVLLGTLIARGRAGRQMAPRVQARHFSDSALGALFGALRFRELTLVSVPCDSEVVASIVRHAKDLSALPDLERRVIGNWMDRLLSDVPATLSN